MEIYSIMFEMSKIIFPPIIVYNSRDGVHAPTKIMFGNLNFTIDIRDELPRLEFICIESLH